METIKILFCCLLTCNSIFLNASEAALDLQEVKQALPFLDSADMYKLVTQSDSSVIRAVRGVGAVRNIGEVRNKALGLNDPDALSSSKDQNDPINAPDKNGITPVIASLYARRSNTLLVFLVGYGADPCGAIDGYFPLDLVDNLLTEDWIWSSQYWSKNKLEELKQSLERAIGVKHLMRGCKKCGFEKPPLYDPDTEKLIFD